MVWQRHRKLFTPTNLDTPTNLFILAFDDDTTFCSRDFAGGKDKYTQGNCINIMKEIMINIIKLKSGQAKTGPAGSVPTSMYGLSLSCSLPLLSP